MANGITIVQNVLLFICGTGLMLVVGVAMAGIIRKSSIEILKTTVDALEASNKRYQEDVIDLKAQVRRLGIAQKKASINSDKQERRVDILLAHNSELEQLVSLAFEVLQRLGAPEAEKLSSTMAKSRDDRHHREEELHRWDRMMRSALDYVEEHPDDVPFTTH